MGEKMKKKILLLFIGLFLMVPKSANAEYLVSHLSYGVTEKEQKLIEEEQAKRNIVGELNYRFTEKDERDTIDYTILTILILAMVIVIILLNKKTYVVFRETSVFEDETIAQS